MRHVTISSRNYLFLIKLCNELICSFRYVVFSVKITALPTRYQAKLNYIRVPGINK